MTDEEFRDNYHIDHVRPLASFDMTDSDQQYEAFSWTNFKPLLASKNLSKGDKRDY